MTNQFDSKESEWIYMYSSLLHRSIKAENAHLSNTFDENKLSTQNINLKEPSKLVSFIPLWARHWLMISRQYFVWKQSITYLWLPIISRLSRNFSDLTSASTLKSKTTCRKSLPTLRFLRSLLLKRNAKWLFAWMEWKWMDNPFSPQSHKKLCIGFIAAQWVKNQTADVYQDALTQVFRVYNTGGFKVTRIHCDKQEFFSLMEPLAKEFQVTINYANQQEHVPEAECNNHVIKERVHARCHQLP